MGYNDPRTTRTTRTTGLQPITTGFGGAGSRIMGYNDRSPNPQERNIGYDRMGGPDRTLPGSIMHMLENPNNYRSMDERIGLENLQEDNIWNRLMIGEKFDPMIEAEELKRNPPYDGPDIMDLLMSGGPLSRKERYIADTQGGYEGIGSLGEGFYTSDGEFVEAPLGGFDDRLDSIMSNFPTTYEGFSSGYPNNLDVRYPSDFEASGQASYARGGLMSLRR